MGSTEEGQRRRTRAVPLRVGGKKIKTQVKMSNRDRVLECLPLYESTNLGDLVAKVEKSRQTKGRGGNVLSSHDVLGMLQRFVREELALYTPEDGVDRWIKKPPTRKR